MYAIVFYIEYQCKYFNFFDKRNTKHSIKQLNVYIVKLFKTSYLKIIKMYKIRSSVLHFLMKNAY